MKIRFFRYFFAAVLLVIASVAWGRGADVLSLAGPWYVRLDGDSVGVDRGYFRSLGGDIAALPGTLDQAQLGTRTVGADYGILSRRHEFIGPAWYSREVEVPKSWAGRDVTLFLERVMWQSRVWVDGVEMGMQDGLGTPHHHWLGRLSAGRHLITVRVNNDMIHNIGDKGHSYGEYTQIIWNGVLGRIELRAVEKQAVTGVRVWPEATKKNVRLTFNLPSTTPSGTAQLQYVVRERSTGHVAAKLTERVTLSDTLTPHAVNIPITGDIKLWDEFSPTLYNVDITTKNGTTESRTFGFRDISTDRSKITINGRPTWIRGNLDCVHFPLTGFPACDVAAWEEIFKIYKAHGLNQVRFHSWCPPEAAFEAADRLGIYIQAEVVWIDWWMSVINNERPEMTTLGLPRGLGHNPSADAFVQAEMRRMVDAYGNHPSFTMMCIGNELGNSDFPTMQSWIDELRTYDPRRLYAVSTARTITSTDQFMVTHNIPQVGATYGLQAGRGTDFDLENNYAQASIPIIAHELGQFPVHPLWSEIDKYTGVLEARNLVELKELAVRNQLAEMDTAFHHASGALQTILYKALLENLARTPSCAGFSFLSMTDYSGQGEALVGWLDSFWESKGIVRPEDFRGYSNDVMLLARFPRYTWRSGERFGARIQVANYGPEALDQTARWSLTNSLGELVDSGVFEKSAPQGRLTDLGEISITLPEVKTGEKLTLTTAYDSLERRNSWSIWVFPHSAKNPAADTIYIDTARVVECARFDSTAVEALRAGKRVVVWAHDLGREEGVTPLNFTPLFWSNSFFPGQSNKTLGMYINAEHRALAGFPTSSHTDWQWQSLCRGRSFILNSHPNLRPIVQPISDFHISDRLGSIFECRVGGGQLLVCGHDLTGDEPEAKALRNSLLQYAASNDFDPKYEILTEELATMLYSIPAAKSELPQGFEGATLYTVCGKNLATEGAKPWDKKLDAILALERGCDYTVTCENTWRDAAGTAWTGREITVEIATPNGILCDLYVKLVDPNAQQRRGVVTIEGRESAVEKIDAAGTWVKLFVMREDTNDGKITFRARSTTDKNLMISELALIKQ